VNIKRVTIVEHSDKPGIEQVKADLLDLLERRGLEVAADDPDLVVSLGGDGTMLRAAQFAHAKDVPLLGINFGTLGYLTEVEAGDETAALEKVLAGDFTLDERMMLRAECRDAEMAHVGLNEVLIERVSRQRLVRLLVSVGGDRLAAFNADGVLVATPTGSTAYALSAGGPIVSPRAHCMVLVPVSAHMIFSRPFVLAPDEIIEIEVDPNGEPAAFSLDGAIGGDIPAGATVVVRRHFRPLLLIRLSGPGFVERLRTKLGLP
jgi:NAD+ kinase